MRSNATRTLRTLQRRPHAPTPRERLEAITGIPNFVTLQAVRVAVALRLPDLIEAGVVVPEALAEATNTDLDALTRLVSHLKRKGLLLERPGGGLTLTETGRLLRKNDSEERAAHFDLEGVQALIEGAMCELIYSIRTGQPAWSRLHDEGFWDHLQRNPTAAMTFDQNMHDRMRVLAPEISDGYNWASISVVVDVGGGNGELLGHLLRGHRHLRAILVDSSPAETRAEATLTRAGVLERCAIVTQSFFDPLPSGGEAYLLSSVLHDWGDEDCVRILGRCREAAGPGGRVLMVEQPLDVADVSALSTFACSSYSAAASAAVLNTRLSQTEAGSASWRGSLFRRRGGSSTAAAEERGQTGIVARPARVPERGRKIPTSQRRADPRDSQAECRRSWMRASPGLAWREDEGVLVRHSVDRRSELGVEADV